MSFKLELHVLGTKARMKKLGYLMPKPRIWRHNLISASGLNHIQIHTNTYTYVSTLIHQSGKSVELDSASDLECALDQIHVCLSISHCSDVPASTAVRQSIFHPCNLLMGFSNEDKKKWLEPHSAINLPDLHMYMYSTRTRACTICTCNANTQSCTYPRNTKMD